MQAIAADGPEAFPPQAFLPSATTTIAQRTPQGCGSSSIIASGSKREKRRRRQPPAPLAAVLGGDARQAVAVGARATQSAASHAPLPAAGGTSAQQPAAGPPPPERARSRSRQAPTAPAVAATGGESCGRALSGMCVDTLSSPLAPLRLGAAQSQLAASAGQADSCAPHMRRGRRPASYPSIVPLPAASRVRLRREPVAPDRVHELEVTCQTLFELRRAVPGGAAVESSAILGPWGCLRSGVVLAGGVSGNLARVGRPAVKLKNIQW